MDHTCSIVTHTSYCAVLLRILALYTVNMASNIETTRDSPELIIEELKRETNVTDQQVDTRIEQPDLPVIASYFDNINHGYLEAMNLNPGQQTDVKEKTHVSGTLAGIMLALTLWLNSQLRGTFRALIFILLSLGKILVAVQVFKYLSKEDFTPPQSPQKKRKHSSKEDFPPPPGPSQERNPRLSSYRDYLKSLYQTLTLSSTTQWPPVSTKKVFKLAIIQKEKIQRGRMDDEFVRLKITGKIDDILVQKKPVDLKDIFFEINDKRKIVLIEGSPGSGKSTLALHICQEWAEGKLFQEFDITILVRLRDPSIRDANLAIETLLPRRRSESVMASNIGIEILKTDGKGILWVLDGWDELPSHLSQDSIIKKLIRPIMAQESLLHKSTVIITSRPSSSAELHQLVSSRVEVLGFTSQQLEQYFTDCLNGDSQAVKTLLERIRENPEVESSCYLPLNASIIVNCFLCNNQSLPTTNHQIFTSVIQSSLKRYLQDKLGKTTPVGNITSPNLLPSELRTPFTKICQLAYHGINQNKVTFTNKDFTNFSITKDISNIGLLQSVPSILGHDQLVYYCFLYLSIQELLAAIHISLMSSKDQVSAFQNLFGQPRFSAVFQFYAGITKLTTSRQFYSKLPQWLYPYPTAILDLVRKIVKSECEKKHYEPKPLLLSLINCLYEAQDLSLYVLMADLLNHELDLRNTTINPIDCLSVGYFASLITKPFSLDLSYCSISDQSCKFLARGLSKCPHSHCKIDLDLSSNSIHNKGIHYIAKILTNTTLLSQINLSLNKIGDSGLNTLCDALSTNTSLTHLTLSHCWLNLNDHGTIPRLLRTNTTLQQLDLSDNKIGNTEISNLCDALSTNISLTHLTLIYCSLTLNDHGAIPQLLRTNTTLQYLCLSRNKIGSTELSNICNALSTNTSLKILNLRRCSLRISDDNEVALHQLLSQNNSVEDLDLSGNTVNSCHHIAAGLAVNKTLRILGLANCKLTDRSIEELSTGLINNIEILYIHSNKSITEDGIKTLARQLTTHCPKLNTLTIPLHLFSCIETMFREVYKERIRTGLTEIKLDAW